MYNIDLLAIDIGHNVDFDRGAVGIKQEDELNRLVGETVISKCRQAGMNVVNCTPASALSTWDSLNRRCEIANNAQADFFISIHHNACPGGEGAEALCITGGNSEAVGELILNEIEKLKFINRGVKDRRDLFVINNTVMPALIIECAFVDSPSDMARYDYREMARAIFNGLCKSFNHVSNAETIEMIEEKIYQNVIKEEKVYHNVIRGENLWLISRNYGVTVDQIVGLNNIKNKNLIYEGQVLRVK